MFCSPKDQYKVIKYGVPIKLAKLPLPVHIGIPEWRRLSSVIRTRSKPLTDSRIAIVDDTISRGIDLPRTSLVVNFSVPTSFTTYIHRSGRVGRIASPHRRQSAVVTFVEKGSKDEKLLQKYTSRLRIPLQEWPHTILPHAYTQLHQQTHQQLRDQVK
uniref:ATP-dependent RNA helicase n=1 Tax=Lygus hesperus TaxID=30085 RepID=A0A0A9X9M1_LYGHE